MTKVPTASHCMALRLLLSVAVAVAVALMFAIMTAASAAAFFQAARACRVLSATNLPAATRLGFFWRSLVVVGEVICYVIS